MARMSVAERLLQEITVSGVLV